LPGISVDGIDVSGFAGPVLDDFLQQRQTALKRRVIRVRVGTGSFPVSGADAGITPEPEFAARVMEAGRAGNILAQVGWRVGRWFSPQVFSTHFRVDEAKVDDLFTKIEQAALTTPKEGSIRFVAGKLDLTYPAEGETIERRAATQLLSDVLNGEATEVMLPTVKWSPATTREGVDDAKRRFQAAIGQPIEMFVRFPESEVPEGAADGTNEEEQQGRIEKVSPRLFAPALHARPAKDEPGKLELEFDVDELDKALADVRKRWERPAVNAQFIPDRQNRLRIEPSKAQWVLRSESAASALLDAVLSEERRGVWTLEVGEQPKVTTELANQLNVKHLVASFTTSHPCCRPRVENIHRIADLINGTIVLPGETYSVNETLGPRTAANGFTMAPTIVKGEMDDTVGGGISQFATTLFNAVLRGGYEIIERQPHSIYFNRYPMGHEATLSYPKPDLIFRNDTQSAMVIRTAYTGTSIKVMIFGDNDGRVVTTDVSKPFDTVEPDLEYVADPALAPDEEKVEEKGDYGFTVYASRTVREKDGTERKETRKVIYKPRARRLIVHPCKIPEGFEGHTGEKCPVPEVTTPDAGTGAG